jgi:hypothetical protein
MRARECRQRRWPRATGSAQIDQFRSCPGGPATSTEARRPVWVRYGMAFDTIRDGVRRRGGNRARRDHPEVSAGPVGEPLPRAPGRAPEDHSRMVPLNRGTTDRGGRCLG